MKNPWFQLPFCDLEANTELNLKGKTEGEMRMSRSQSRSIVFLSVRTFLCFVFVWFCSRRRRNFASEAREAARKMRERNVRVINLINNVQLEHLTWILFSRTHKKKESNILHNIAELDAYFAHFWVFNWPKLFISHNFQESKASDWKLHMYQIVSIGANKRKSENARISHTSRRSEVVQSGHSS